MDGVVTRSDWMDLTKFGIDGNETHQRIKVVSSVGFTSRIGYFSDLNIQKNSTQIII